MQEYNTYLILGLQWGDEGKGKIIDMLSFDSDYVVSYQGGNDAGHTIYDNDKRISLDMLPLGIINTNGKCILSSGVSVDIESLLDEVYYIEKNFKPVNNLYIDGRANIIMPYHTMLDQMNQKKENNKDLLKTKNGIVSCNIDKFNKVGIRMSDLLNLENFSNKLMQNLNNKNELLLDKGMEALDFEYVYNKYLEYSNRIKNIIIDTVPELNKAIVQGKKIIFESAHSAMMDINYGTYPSCSGVPTVSATVCTGAGIAPNKLKNIIGVFKAYTTKTFDGIFPTEIIGQDANHLRDKGQEYVSKTGAARRCGWLDLGVLKYMCMINGVTELNMTKIDVLSGIQTLKLAIGYEIDGRVYQTYPINYDVNKEVNILYKEFEPWNEDISQITDYDDLPENCKRYIEYIEGYLETKITVISTGPKKENILIR